MQPGEKVYNVKPKVHLKLNIAIDRGNQTVDVGIFSDLSTVNSPGACKSKTPSSSLY